MLMWVRVLILIVMEERIGYDDISYKRVVNTNVLILIVMEERIGFPLGASEPLTRDCCLNPYCNGRKNRIA